jgi:hypothetical protein
LWRTRILRHRGGIYEVQRYIFSGELGRCQSGSGLGIKMNPMNMTFTIANDYDPDGDMSANADPMTAYRTYSGLVLENDHREHVVRFVPCVLKNLFLNKWLSGRALRRSDGMLLALLGLPVGDVAFEGFIHGHLIGREEERNRTRHILHDVLSSKILVASFMAHEIYQNLSGTDRRSRRNWKRSQNCCRK